MTILGISGLYHDSAAAIVRDGRILAAAQEERFTRIKNDPSLPVHAIEYCLKEAGISMPGADAVVYYDQPALTLDRYLHNVLALGGEAEPMLESGFENLIENRLGIDRLLRRRYGVLGREDRLYTLEHHLSHAASAFYPSPFERAAVLTVDGVGEWATTAIGFGEKNHIELIKEIRYPHSLGLFYSAFTSFCGFRVNSGEYKFMGLAPYGEPVYEKLIRNKIIELHEDGSFELALDCFDFYRSSRMTGRAFAALFEGDPRQEDAPITRREMDLAASVQKITEEILLRLAREAKRTTGCRDLALAGGVALNCAANGKLQRAGVFERLFIQPAAGDAGGALGAALYGYYALSGSKREPEAEDSQQGSYLGPEFCENEIRTALDRLGARYTCLPQEELLRQTAEALAQGAVVGWFQGRAEFGPRALGHRSILADPRRVEMQETLNRKIKFRESFRPFAPSVLAEDASDYFDLNCESPYMLLIAPVREDRRLPFDISALREKCGDDMLPLIRTPRSDIPAVTHVDFSARVQTVSKERNGIYYDLLTEFKKTTGCSVLVNTSFNVRGEPIVQTPEEAYACFQKTDMDLLVIGSCILRKEEQEGSST